jgi:hypothetical protein
MSSGSFVINVFGSILTSGPVWNEDNAKVTEVEIQTVFFADIAAVSVQSILPCVLDEEPSRHATQKWSRNMAELPVLRDATVKRFEENKNQQSNGQNGCDRISEHVVVPLGGCQVINWTD